MTDDEAHGGAACEDAFVALGANVGDRLGQLREAARRLGAHAQIDVEAASPVYESAAHTLRPEDEAPPFLNAVVRLRTPLAPEALLSACQEIEETAGRDRTAHRWAPRPLDLDLLVCGAETRATERLTLPHPRLGARRFVLRPLCDLAPNLHVPLPFDATVSALLRRCLDDAALRRTPHRLDAAPPRRRA